MSPLNLASELLERFQPKDSEEKKIVEALRELMALQTFDAQTGKMSGPRLDVQAIARHAQLSRGLISHEGCKLQGARELVIDALGLLKEYSLQVECDYLREENKRLKSRLDRQDSVVANRVVSLHKEKTSAEATPKRRWSAEDVRTAVRVVPMSKI